MMKKMLFVMMALVIFGLAGCNRLNQSFGEVALIDVDTTRLTPEEAKETRESQISNASFVPVLLSHNTKTISDTRLLDSQMSNINIEYDSFFTLIIDIDNPNKDSIHEIRVRDDASGIVHTYQPSQKEDLDGDGVMDDLFYVNADISSIFLGIKMPKSHQAGDEVSYTLVSMTNFENGELKYVQMDASVDPVVTITIEITNMIFGVEFDKTEYGFDHMRGQYDDVYVMLSVFNRKSVNFYSVDLTINGANYNYKINTISNNRKEEFTFLPTCPESYDQDYCKAVIIQIPGEDIEALQHTLETVQVTNEYGSLETSDIIHIEILGINSSAVKDTQVFDDIETPSFTFKTIEASDNYNTSLVINTTVDYQEVTFDLSGINMSDIDPIYVRLYDISIYALMPDETCANIVFDDYGYNDHIDMLLLLTEDSTLTFELAHHSYCAVFVDGNGNPLNNHHTQLIEFDTTFDPANLPIPDITMEAIEGNEGSYDMTIDISGYQSLFDLRGFNVRNSFGDKWSNYRFQVNDPVVIDNLSIFKFIGSFFTDDPNPRLLVTLYVDDALMPGRLVAIEHIIELTFPETD